MLTSSVDKKGLSHERVKRSEELDADSKMIFGGLGPHRTHYTGAWGKITPMKSLPNISDYVSLKDFTPDLIFLYRYICNICEFCNSVRCKSLLVWVKCTGARGKITQMKVLPNISAYVTLPIFYPRPPKLLHRYICRFCDILLLCKVG